MYGGMDSEERERVKAAFQTDPNISPVRILLATDAASEGIDLQNHCSRLIHYEIPWNPNRMEQRNGRIDRHGQKAKKVLDLPLRRQGLQRPGTEHASETTVGDLEADLEFLMRAVRKVEAIREDLGKVGPVIAEQVEEAMLGRRTRLDTRKAENEAEPIRKLLKFERDLEKQIEQLMDQLNETKRELRLTPRTSRRSSRSPWSSPVSRRSSRPRCAGIWPDPKRHACPVFHLPALSGSWALCAEGLTHPLHAARPAPSCSTTPWPRAGKMWSWST